MSESRLGVPNPEGAFTPGVNLEIRKHGRRICGPRGRELRGRRRRRIAEGRVLVAALELARQRRGAALPELGAAEVETVGDRNARRDDVVVGERLDLDVDLLPVRRVARSCRCERVVLRQVEMPVEQVRANRRVLFDPALSVVDVERRRAPVHRA